MMDRGQPLPLGVVEKEIERLHSKILHDIDKVYNTTIIGRFIKWLEDKHE